MSTGNSKNVLWVWEASSITCWRGQREGQGRVAMRRGFFGACYFFSAATAQPHAWLALAGESNAADALLVLED
jgi:hypothetical protein